MLLTDIASYLISAGCGYAPNTANSYPWVYGNYSPDTPDKVIVISDYVAEQPLLTMATPQPLIERPRVQVVCRDAPQEVVACHTTIRNVYVKLCLVNEMTIGSNRYTFVPLDTPTMIGRDDQQRVKYAVNFQVTVQ